MTDDQAFLRAVCENPDDATPRLIYADYLEERGDADRARLLRGGADPAAVARVSRRVAPTYAYPNEWAVWGLPVYWQATQDAEQHQYCVGVLRDRRSDPWVGTGLVRNGMVEDVACATATWEGYGPTIVGRNPVRSVTLVGVQPWNFNAELSPRRRRLRRPWTLFCRDGGLSAGDSTIPAWLFDNLRHDASSQGQAGYATPTDCFRAVSSAAVRWAREQAGLPVWRPHSLEIPAGNR